MRRNGQTVSKELTFMTRPLLLGILPAGDKKREKIIWDG